jgi:hypothetical protein
MKIPRAAAIPFFILPWLGAVAIIGWILIHRFPPNGKFVTSTSFSRASAFINPFLPSERVSVPGVQPDNWTGQRITGDPTYMTARIPGPYEEVEMEIEFRPIHQPLIEFGLVKDAAGLELDLEPLWFEGLMSKAWFEVESGFVRGITTESDLSNGKTQGIATWDATSTLLAIQDPVGPVLETKMSLRGSHDFYFIPSGENLEVVFELQDVNRKRGNTTAVFRVFRGEEEIKREALGTSGSRDTKMGTVFEHRIFLNNLKPGVYRIAFQSDDDVFIRSLKTPSKRWVVGPRLNFGDVVGYATSTPPGHAWTTSRHIVAETFHDEGLQKVQLGPASVNVSRTHEAFRIDRTDTDLKPVELFAPNGDVRLIGDGWFALRSDAFFEPKPRRLSDGTDLEKEGVTGVITNFERPEAIGDGWYRVRKRFDIDPTQDGLRFVLSTPGIASRLGAVDIRNIQLTYTRTQSGLESWIEILTQELKNAWHRL